MNEKICGVYKITNVINGMFYIGSSNNIEYRWKCHIRDLKNNRHVNSHLQNAWNKYGEKNFVFSILEECDECVLRELEQKYIDDTNCCSRNVGYNIANKTDMSEMSDETKIKISNTLTGKYIGENCFFSKYSEETVKNVIDDLMNVDLSYSDIAIKNNVSKSIVCNVCYGSSWSYLTKNIRFPKRESCNKLNKITKNDMDDIIKLILSGIDDKKIGDIYGVNRKTISDIRLHKTWKKYTDGIIFPKSNGFMKGENNNKSKLNIEQIKEIKSKISNGQSLQSIANEYSVSTTTICNIKKNKIYSYI